MQWHKIHLTVGILSLYPQLLHCRMLLLNLNASFPHLGHSLTTANFRSFSNSSSKGFIKNHHSLAYWLDFSKNLLGGF